MGESNDERLARIEGTIGEIKGKLTVLMPTLQGLDGRMRGVEDGLSELKGEVRQMSVRISDMNARMPMSIAYQPPAFAGMMMGWEPYWCIVFANRAF